MGDESRLWAAGAYLLLIFSGVFVYLVRKGDSYARFHAMQSIIFTIALIVLSVLFTIVGIILGEIPFLGKSIGFIVKIGEVVINLLVFLVWLYLMWMAYKGEKFKLPLVGAQAEKMASSG